MGGIAASAFAFGGAVSASSGGRSQPVESWTATEADVQAWLKKARPGDRFIYARGPSLIQGAAAALVRKLTATRDVASHNQRNRDSGVLEYVVIRNRVRVVTEREPVVCPLMMAVLVVLQEAAQARRRCPSDAAIGDETGMTADQVKWQLKKLEAAKMIERRTVRAPGDFRFRVVKVVATGAETAGPAQ